jgi:hypothetical protein
MNIIHPAVIWEIERRKREHDADKRSPLYVPPPEPEPTTPETREVEYVIDFDGVCPAARGEPSQAIG